MIVRLILPVAVLLAAFPLGAQQAKKSVFVAPPRISEALRTAPSLERIRVALTGELNARLASTRRFEPVDRTAAYEAAADAERGLTEVGAAETRGAEFNRLIGAETVLLPEIVLFRDAVNTQDGLTRRTVTLTLQVRVTDTTTSSIPEAVSVTKTVLRTADAANAALLETLPDEVAAEAAAEAVRRLVTALFPAYVIDVDGTTVTVNRGTGWFAEGMTATLFAKSRTVVDPETGEMLRIKGRPVGKIRVTYVEAAYAQGELLDGARAEVGCGVVPDGTQEK